MDVCNAKSSYLGKCSNFAILKVKIATFHIFLAFSYFPIFMFLPIWAAYKLFHDLFASLWNKWPKTCIHHRNPNIPVDLVTLDDLHLKRARRKVEMVLISVPDTIHVDLSTLPLHTVMARDETKHDKSPSILSLTWPVTSSMTPSSRTLGFLL